MQRIALGSVTFYEGIVQSTDFLSARHKHAGKIHGRPKSVNTRFYIICSVAGFPVDFRMILDGEVDDIPEQAFLNVGPIEDAIRKGEEMLAAVAESK